GAWLGLLARVLPVVARNGGWRLGSGPVMKRRTRSSVTPLNNFCLILAAPISFKSSLKWLTFVEVHIVYGNGQKKKVPSQQVPAIKKAS
ncbi:hypothetical protein HGM15179_006238, partial [Zosterops borbonicus]